jgi:hypothetical protein
MAEQQEYWTAELTHLDTRSAYLKTKGEAPTYFFTYELEETGDYEKIYDALRQMNIADGYLRDVNEIAETLIFAPSTVYEPDNLENFHE